MKSFHKLLFELSTHELCKEDFFLSFKLEKTQYEGLILNICKNKIEISHPDLYCLPEQDSLLGASLSYVGVHYESLCLYVEKVSFFSEDKVKIVFHAGDDNTKAILWQLAYHLKHKDVSMTGELDASQNDEHLLPKIPARGVYTEEARQERLQFARDVTDASLSKVEQTLLDPKKLISNIEGFIGSVEIPVGLAGPLEIRGKHAKGRYYAPLATTEGALVASATRGATAISKSGGVKVRVIRQSMLRAPVFVFANLEMALFFVDWLKDHKREICEIVLKYSNFANLNEVVPRVNGKNVNVMFIYETGDAAGQNMVTTCTWQACQWILQQIELISGLKLENFFIENSISGDKRVSFQSFLKGRGIYAIAEACLRKDILEKTLKVSPALLVKTFESFAAGSIATGVVGVNVNIANIIAAMFTSTGQDIACVHESAIGQLSMELTENNDVYLSLSMPSIVVGTVGGGTGLLQQKECLELLGCAGPGNAHKLAEIIISFCLALDLSTLSAIASDQFARAHEKLGRNRPVEWLKKGDLNKAFFTKALQNYYKNKSLIVNEVRPLKTIEIGSSIITELTSHKTKKCVGHFPFQLKYDDFDPLKSLNVMVKVKPLDDEVILMLNSMASMSNPRLAHEYNKHKEHLGFKGCNYRELEVMSQSDTRLVKYIPTVYSTWMDPEKEAYVIVEELLQGLELMDSADDVSLWQDQHIKSAIAGVAEIHSIWYGKEEELIKQNWLIDPPNTEYMIDKERLWSMLGVNAHEEFTQWFTKDDLDQFNWIVSDLKNWYPNLDVMTKTLIHNDFNPRNIAFRKTASGPQLCVYDWELATMNIPQHDLAELLVFTLPNDISSEKVSEYIELHRTELEKATGLEIDAIQWREGYQYSLYDLLINRIAMYIMAHAFRDYKFIERIYKTCMHLIAIEQKS